MGDRIFKNMQSGNSLLFGAKDCVIIFVYYMYEGVCLLSLHI